MEKEILEVGEDGQLATKTIRYNNYRLRSELSQEFLSRKPGFLEDWSLWIFLGLLLFLLTGTWFVRYPDIVNSRVILTAENAPKEIIVKQEGRLIKLIVHNEDKVKRGDVIGWLESTADMGEVLDLSMRIDSSIKILDHGNAERVIQALEKQYSGLGELQQGYQKVISALQLFNDYTNNTFYKKHLGILQDDIRSLDKLSNNLLMQKKLADKDVDLANETFDMYKKLRDGEVITQEEFRNETSKYMNREKAVPQIEASMYNNEMQRREKLKQANQLAHDISQQKLTFQQELRSFKSQIEDWKITHLITAPTEGRVAYTTTLQENKYLRAGNIIGFVNPDSSRYYAETILSQNNLGKLETGMRVQLRFDAYPYQEWGVIDGKLNTISDVPSDSGFLATIKLDNGLITSDRKKLAYKAGLKAQALIITKDSRLLERFYHSLVKFSSVDK